ncbi:hypothetical protein R1flu_000265 [Riccia fluitans]|uniref:PPC domain-containing protein n=1 Tax=Riccia fluitans TaxID=41844 RepID=A0ABD1Y0F2_9MARC
MDLDQMKPGRKRTLAQCYRKRERTHDQSDCGPSDSVPVPSLTISPKPENTLELLTIEPGKDVIHEISYFFDTFGSLYIEKASGAVSCATLGCPSLNSVQNFTGESFKIINLYGPVPGRGDPRIEDGLWVLLGNKAGAVFWGKALKPLIAETPVKVWIVR